MGVPVKNILVCGHGLAAHMTVAALSNSLGNNFEVIFVETPNNSDTDLLYGTVTSPTAYAFHLLLGLSEPALFRSGHVGFSLGTQYNNWVGRDLSWLQCFQLPLPIWQGVPFHQHLLKQDDTDLEPYLISAQAAKRGVFAHPPDDSKNPWSRAEYGYHFDPVGLTDLLKQQIAGHGVRHIKDKIDTVQCEDGRISAIILNNGEQLTADFFIDCTGPDAVLLSHLGTENESGRELAIYKSTRKSTGPSSPVRNLVGADFGWQANTPIQGTDTVITVFDQESEAEAKAAHGQEPEMSAQARIGRKTAVWSGNCVAIGHAAAVLDPVSPAPYLMLENDIRRLLKLLPVSIDMHVEQREFSREFDNDFCHMKLFNDALISAEQLPDTAYWQNAVAQSQTPKLVRKLQQFKSRGRLVTYDFEPFNEQDWTILHFGMGRRPDRYDPFADQINSTAIIENLNALKRANANMVSKIPPHDLYVSKFLTYLEKNHDKLS